MQAAIAAITTYWFQHIWTPTFLVALAVASPKIASTVGGFFLQRAFDRKIATLAMQSATIADDKDALDGFTRQVEIQEMSRGSFLLMLNAVNADLSWKLMTDQLYRKDGQSALRRVAAIVYPDDYKPRTAPIDAILATDYGAENVAPLLAFVTSLNADARHKLTSLQTRFNVLSDEKESLERRKARWSNVIDGVGWIATIVAFVLKGGE